MKTNNNGGGNSNNNNSGNGTATTTTTKAETDRLLNRNVALCGAVTAVSMS